MKKIQFITLTHFFYGRYEYDLLAPFRAIKADLKRMKELKERDKH